jgi:excisionase family DNA binding protein
VTYPETMDTEEAASFLRCSWDHVHDIARRGLISHMAYGGKYRFDTESLLNYGMRGSPLPDRMWKVKRRNRLGMPRTYASAETAQSRVSDILFGGDKAIVYRATRGHGGVHEAVGEEVLFLPLKYSDHAVHQEIEPKPETP